MTRWLIVAWNGDWVLPDHDHGGIDPGPYQHWGTANDHLQAVARAIEEGWIRDGHTPEFAAREKRIFLAYHTIIRLDWPTYTPEEEP